MKVEQKILLRVLITVFIWGVCLRGSFAHCTMLPWFFSRRSQNFPPNFQIATCFYIGQSKLDKVDQNHFLQASRLVSHSSGLVHWICPTAKMFPVFSQFNAVDILQQFCIEKHVEFVTSADCTLALSQLCPFIHS